MTNDDSDNRISTLCHDLRQNVAAGLMLTTERPGDDALPDGVRERLQLAAEQLRALAEALAAQSIPQMRVTDLADLAAECARTAASAHDVRVALLVEARPTIYVEPSSVRRAVNNLLDNAVRATRSRSVEVHVRCHRGYAVVEVHDDGLGFGTIPARTGWGLAQVRATSDAHGGLLERGSSRTGGTMMRLSLPLPRGVPGRAA